jgi:hypothetical protein
MITDSDKSTTPTDRRHLHAVAFAVDLRYAIDDNLANVKHAGNLYRQLPPAEEWIERWEDTEPEKDKTK